MITFLSFFVCFVCQVIGSNLYGSRFPGKKMEACELSVDMPPTATKILCHCEGLLTAVKFASGFNIWPCLLSLQNIFLILIIEIFTYNSAIIMQSFCIVSRSLQYRLKSCFVLGITLLCGP